MATEQRLIDANELYLGKFVKAGMSDYKNGWNDALDAAATQAPTVDAVPVVRCKDCKHFNDVSAIPVIADSKKLVCMKGVNWRAVEPNHFCSYGERRTDNGLQRKDDIANGVTIQKWIPVTERLPEQYHAVIVWTRYRELGEATYDGKHFRWDCDEDYVDVTHWMPLPEPPKGE